jgi:hypothetical protein
MQSREVKSLRDMKCPKLQVTLACAAENALPRMMAGAIAILPAQKSA